LRIRHTRLLRIEKPEHERFDDFALEHARAVSKQAKAIDRSHDRRRSRDECAVNLRCSVHLLDQRNHRHAGIVIGEALEAIKDFACDDFLARAGNQPVIKKNR
jgi:hypothetical protein